MQASRALTANAKFKLATVITGMNAVAYGSWLDAARMLVTMQDAQNPPAMIARVRTLMAGMTLMDKRLAIRWSC
jgi:hypothetical protein